MKLISPPNARPVHLVLAKDRVRSIKRGHPWIFPEVLAELPQAPAGSIAILKDRNGEILAKGFYDPNSKLAFRICALTERLDDASVRAKLERAVILRRALVIGRDTTGYRLVNGEGDGLPGLVCDLYQNTAVIKLDGDGPAGFYCSQEPHKPITFLENNLKFTADVIKGQKTGFFFDQRDNRQRLAVHARGKRFLNLFGYTGGFSVYAGIAGATHVTTVDVAAAALTAAQNNWELNDLPPQAHVTAAQDAFVFLESARASKELWDVVVVDPPSFAPSEAAVERAKASYERIFALAAGVTAPGGVLAMASCSSHLPAQDFLDVCGDALGKARRRGMVLGVHGQPEDHPYPAACEELRYLKFVVMRLD